MAEYTRPGVGHPVLHHGRLHEITELRTKPTVVDGEVVKREVAVWENEDYRVKGWADELVWSEADEAYYLPGRVLARDERAVHEAVVGVWPKAESHMAARKYLDTIDLEEDVDTDTLVDVLQRRKAYDVPEGETWDEDDWRQHAEACLEHCRELRSSRS